MTDEITGDGSGVQLPLVANLDDQRPHISMLTIDGNAHVIPCALIEKIISGDMLVSECEDFDIVVRSIFKEWYETLKNG